MKWNNNNTKKKEPTLFPFILFEPIGYHHNKKEIMRREKRHPANGYEKSKTTTPTTMNTQGFFWKITSNFRLTCVLSVSTILTFFSYTLNATDKENVPDDGTERERERKRERKKIFFSCF
jgi:hypothetical protein